MSETANKWVSAFFVFGVVAFLIFNQGAVVQFAQGLVTTGVSLSSGLAGVKQS